MNEVLGSLCSQNKTKVCPFLLGRLIFTALFFFCIWKNATHAQTVALPSAFAHNDYRHKHPFHDAIKNGFTHIESDIFLHNGRLLVSHRSPYFRGNHTLENMYLKPLSDYIISRQNATQTAMDTITLMIDVKSNGEKTYAALKDLFEKYKPLLSYSENGQIVHRNLTIVLSGNRPLSMLRDEETRHFFVDERLQHVNSDEQFNSMYAMASCRYAKLFKWKGKGPMPENERKLLCDLVAKAHEFGKKVRLWASPEKEKVWTELLNCGVDLINTDKLEEFRAFSTNNKASIAVADYEPWVE